MNIERRPISSLLDYSFIIPAYQRGYRWDREQVESMLDDFMEFCHNSEGKSTFYCLQPVVVVPETSAPDCRRFEVADGQQRLTTLYLILSYFRSKEDYPTETYRLEMPSRDSQEKYIGEDGFLTAENGEDSNIDNFYLRKAYETIHGRLQKDPDFGRLLRRRIGRDLKVREYVNGENNERPADRQGLDSPDLAYEQAESAKLISILEAHNVWTVERNMDKSTRFPFLLFRKNKSTSLEHIHPQNITDSNAFDDYNDWFRNRRSEIPKALALYQQRKGVDRKPDMELKVLESERQLEILLSDIAKLKTGHARAFEDKAEEIRAHVLVIDSLFGDMASISPRELHHIKNLALVDGPTNSALQNYFLDDKRKILISRMEQGYYIPEATRNVFSKYYSAGNVKDMNFWSPADREAYLDDIREVYDFFTASV